MASIMMDGNFSAQHQHMKNPEDDVQMADGHGFMTEDKPYKDHLQTAVQIKQVQCGQTATGHLLLLTLMNRILTVMNIEQ